MKDPMLREMFDEWFTSLPVEGTPLEGTPAHDLLIDAWIAGFAKHNEITVAAQKRSKKQKIEEQLRQSDLTAQLCGGRPEIEYGHHESLPRGEHVSRPRK